MNHFVSTSFKLIYEQISSVFRHTYFFLECEFGFIPSRGVDEGRVFFNGQLSPDWVSQSREWHTN